MSAFFVAKWNRNDVAVSLEVLSSPQESVTKTLELLKQNIICLPKKRSSKNKKGKLLLEVKSA